MAKSNNSYIKKQKEAVKKRKKQDKAEKKTERQKNSLGSDLEHMLAYVDEYGNLSDTPPEPKVVPKNTAPKN